jgi:hypothetical protein
MLLWSTRIGQGGMRPPQKVSAHGALGRQPRRRGIVSTRSCAGSPKKSCPHGAPDDSRPGGGSQDPFIPCVPSPKKVAFPGRPGRQPPRWRRHGPFLANVLTPSASVGPTILTSCQAVGASHGRQKSPPYSMEGPSGVPLSTPRHIVPKAPRRRISLGSGMGRGQGSKREEMCERTFPAEPVSGRLRRCHPEVAATVLTNSAAFDRNPRLSHHSKNGDPCQALFFPRDRPVSEAWRIACRAGASPCPPVPGGKCPKSFTPAGVPRTTAAPVAVPVVFRPHARSPKKFYPRGVPRTTAAPVAVSVVIRPHVRSPKKFCPRGAGTTAAPVAVSMTLRPCALSPKKSCPRGALDDRKDPPIVWRGPSGVPLSTPWHIVPKAPRRRISLGSGMGSGQGGKRCACAHSLRNPSAAGFAAVTQRGRRPFSRTAPPSIGIPDCHTLAKTGILVKHFFP